MPIFEQESRLKKGTLRLSRAGTGNSRFSVRHHAAVSGPPAIVGPRMLQPAPEHSSLLKFTPAERAKEEAFYRTYTHVRVLELGDGIAGAETKAAGTASAFGENASERREKKIEGVNIAGAAVSEVATAISKKLTKEAERSQNYGLIGGDKVRVSSAAEYKLGRWVEQQHRRNRPIRQDKHQAKKVANERITLEKEKLYEMHTGKEAPSAIKRRRKEMKRRQMRQLADKTIGVKRTDVLVRVTRVVKQVVGRMGAAVISWAGIPLLVILLVTMLVFGFGSMLLTALTNTAVVTMSSYTSDEADIEAASLLATQLEANLEKEIAGIPSSWEWAHIDEFRYFTEDIGHDPFELMAYLSVKYPGFDMGLGSPVPLAISDLHNKRYKLELDEVVETRTETEVSTDPITGEQIRETYEYKYYILNIYLTSRSIESVARPELEELEDGDLWEWYQVLMDTGGARQEFANPFPGLDWRDHTSSLYGYRLDPIGRKNLQIHRGLDIAQPTGTPITAGLTGEVAYVGYDSTYGNYIILKDDKGTQLKYAHCHSTSVTRGDPVMAGETVIGTVGNTGASTGSHLHIEAERGGKYINPIYAVIYDEEVEP